MIFGLIVTAALLAIRVWDVFRTDTYLSPWQLAPMLVLAVLVGIFASPFCLGSKCKS